MSEDLCGYVTNSFDDSGKVISQFGDNVPLMQPGWKFAHEANITDGGVTSMGILTYKHVDNLIFIADDGIEPDAQFLCEIDPAGKDIQQHVEKPSESVGWLLSLTHCLNLQLLDLWQAQDQRKALDPWQALGQCQDRDQWKALLLEVGVTRRYEMSAKQSDSSL